MNYLYLLVNFFTISIPLLFSFHPRIRFHKFWPAFFVGAVLVAVPYLVWDSLFTAQGIWGFNQRYLSGLYLWNLPLEEVLFFICIPFSCVFTYFCLEKFFALHWDPRWERVFSLIFSLALILVGIIFWEKSYTSLTFVSLGILCLLLKFVLKIDWFGKAVVVYGILLLPFLIVNGILTGTGLEEPVVWYDTSEIIGIRILSIPVEDAFYGFGLILLNIYFFKLFVRVFRIVDLEGEPARVAGKVQ